jgi:CDI immunity protein
MLYPNLFEDIQYENDPLWIVKEFLNTLDGLAFNKRANYIANGVGQSTECAGCIFPNDPKDYDEELHDGVFCYYFDDNIVVNEKDFMKLFKVACERYLVIHSDSIDSINRLDIQSVIRKINSD